MLIVKHNEEYPISLNPQEAKSNARNKKAGFERMGYQLGFKSWIDATIVPSTSIRDSVGIEYSL